MDIYAYIVNYKNEERKTRMIERFKQFSIIPIFIPGVEMSDHRLKDAPDGCKRVWAIMLQHLDCIRHYYENFTSGYCIVCEDDIHLSKTLATDLLEIVPQFEKLHLDVAMLGYLMSFKIDMTSHIHKQYFPVIGDTKHFNFHKYPDDVWGTQMYLISRKYAQYVLETFTTEYALKKIPPTNFSSDWIITKNGNRALIYPMIAVEEGVNLSDNLDQNQYHRICHDINYHPDKYL